MPGTVPDPAPLPTIAPAGPAEAETCPEIERRASSLFRDTEHAWLVGQAARAGVYVEAADRGDLFVARDRDAGPIGFVLVRALGPDALYVGELAVLPAHQGRRLGARLLRAAEDSAAARGLRWLVLRTFRDVPWNAPYYRRLGFDDPPPGLSDETLAEMATIAATEARHGLAEDERVFLARRVGQAG